MVDPVVDRQGQRMRRLMIVMLVGWVTAGLVAGCASAPRVAVIRDPEADFGRYSTFGFYEPLGTDREGGTGTILSRTLRNATQRELESLGYRLDQDNADIRVNFFVETREVIQGRRGPSMSVGYGVYHRHYGVWTGYETDIRQYTESTLHVDVIDAEEDQLIWEAIATERLADHDLAFEQGNVESSVARIFADFPRRRLVIMGEQP
jgi:hypothetical protein